MYNDIDSRPVHTDPARDEREAGRVAQGDRMLKISFVVWRLVRL